MDENMLIGEGTKAKIYKINEETAYKEFKVEIKSSNFQATNLERLKDINIDYFVFPRELKYDNKHELLYGYFMDYINGIEVFKIENFKLDDIFFSKLEDLYKSIIKVSNVDSLLLNDLWYRNIMYDICDSSFYICDTDSFTKVCSYGLYSVLKSNTSKFNLSILRGIFHCDNLIFNKMFQPLFYKCMDGKIPITEFLFQTKSHLENRNSENIKDTNSLILSLKNHK